MSKLFGRFNCKVSGMMCRVQRTGSVAVYGQGNYLPITISILKKLHVVHELGQSIPKYRHYDIAYCYIIVPNKSHTLRCRCKDARSQYWATKVGHEGQKLKQECVT